jgi:hypothetical protein
VIELSTLPGRGALERTGTAGTVPPAQPSRRGSRGGDLLFGGVLALILLVACLAWEVLYDTAPAPHAALQGQGALAPAAR